MPAFITGNDCSIGCGVGGLSELLGLAIGLSLVTGLLDGFVIGLWIVDDAFFDDPFGLLATVDVANDPDVATVPP